MVNQLFSLFVIFALLFLSACENQDPITADFSTNTGDQAETEEIQGFSKSGRFFRGCITVMTRNVYVGTDVDMVLAAQDPSDIPVLAAQAFQMLLSTKFHERAKAFAEEIYWTRPHLIGLQEISLIRTQMPGDAIAGGTIPAEDIVYDYLDILMEALHARGLNYRVAGMIKNADVEVPMVVNTDPLSFDDVRLTDYDVILVHDDVLVSNVEAANYQTRLPVPSLGVEIPRGYVAVDAKVNSKTYRFVNTHLEPASIPEILPVQMDQAQELVTILANETLPTIIVGDFNSPATYGESYQLFESNDFVDVWTRNLLPFNPDGFTDHHDLDLRNTVVNLDKRIDLIFVKSHVWKHNQQKTGPVFGIVVGDEVRDRTPSGLWPSDHTGVVAKLRIPPYGRFGDY